MYLYLTEKDDYHWHDGTPLKYTNWAPGQPSSPSERCVELFPNTGQWNDRKCEEMQGYVCMYTKGNARI